VLTVQIGLGCQQGIYFSENFLKCLWPHQTIQIEQSDAIQFRLAPCNEFLPGVAVECMQWILIQIENVFHPVTLIQN